MCVCVCAWGGGARTIKKDRGVLTGARDPYPFLVTTETPFPDESKMNIYPIVDNQCMLICSVI